MSKFNTTNLECIRRDNILFQGLDFSLEDGELLQIDGVNGSGKSSLLRICAGLVQASEGTVFWDGKDINECRYQYQQIMTYIGHTNGVKDGLTAKENINVIHALSGHEERINHNEVLKQIGLPDVEDVLLGKMSAGQKRRIGLTRLIINSSKIWLLDEPFTSLDVTGKSIIEKLIVEHCQKGGMVIFATHQAMEIEGHEVRHIHLGRNNE